MNSKRLNGHRLLLVIAVIGILSTHVISAQDDEDTSVATTEEVPGPTTAAGDQSTSEDSTAATGVETVTSVAQETQETSAGETGASTGTEGLGIDRATGESTPEGTVTVEIATSAGELSTAGRGAPQTEGDKTGTPLLESSTVGAEDGATTTVTGAPSKDATTEALLGIIKEDTTGTTATKEGTASVEQTKEATTAKYTTYVGRASTERQAAAPTEQIQSCEPCQAIEINDSCTEWKISTSICKDEAENKHNVTIVIQDQRNSSRTRISTRTFPRKLNCSTVVNQLEESLNRMLVKKISTRPSPMPCPTPSPTPSPTSPAPSPEPERSRKRRQANEATTSEPRKMSVPTDLDIDDIFNAAEDALENLANISSEISSPQSTHSLAESGTASSTTSATLTTGPIKEELTKPPSKALEEHNKSSKQDVWEAHYGLFLTIVILISVCVVVTAVCCLCMAWRRRGQDKHSDKQPIAMEEAREGPVAVSNPIPDAEMIQDEAPMQERENPAVTPNGGGQHISKADEDNGWVVPLDELSKAEKEKPEVENTRL